MKPSIFALLLFAFSHTLLAQKAIQNPSFSATNVPYLKVQKVVVSDTATLLEFESKPGMNFRISSKSYLLQNNNSDKLLLKGARGIELDKFVSTKEQTKFSLVFPALNPTSSLIDFIEDDCDGCFKILDISLRPDSGKKLLKQAFWGDWYTTDGKKDWVLGLYDSIAIYKNQVWNYTYSVNGKNALLSLKRKGENRTLSAELGSKNEALYLAEENQARMFLSHNRQGPLSSKFDEEYSANLLKSDSGIYRGFLGAYSPKLGFKTGQVYINNNITGEQESYLITIDAAGNFYSKFPMHYPQQVFVRFPGKGLSVYCEPGKETFQFINLANPAQAQQFMGDCALINEELRYTEFIFDEDYDKTLADIHGFSPAQYKEYILAKEKPLLNLIASYKQKMFLSKKAVSYLEMEAKFKTAADLFNYNRQIESAYRKVNKVPDTKKGPFVKSVMLDSTYFDYVRSLPLNDERAFITGGYNTFVNRIRFADLGGDKKFSLTLPQIVEGLKKGGLVFSDEDEQVISRLADTGKSLSKDTIAARKQSQDLSKKVAAFQVKYSNAISQYMSNAFSERALQRLKSVFQLKEGLLTDVLYSQGRASSIKRSFVALDRAEMENINSNIKTPAVAAALVALNNEIAAKIEVNKKKSLVINDVPEGKEDRVLTSILEKYKGKVVYVDFWATWCSPCMNGIQQIAPLKEEMKDENVVFLYITNQTSPLETYKNVVPGIKGEHYRVNPDQWNYLSAKFKISGIPHYMLVDKTGHIVNENLSHLNNRELKARILALK